MQSPLRGSCRSKRKCDKKVPCSSCVGRGLRYICPNGMSSFVIVRARRVDSHEEAVTAPSASELSQRAAGSISASASDAGAAGLDAAQRIPVLSSRMHALEDALYIERGTRAPFSALDVPASVAQGYQSQPSGSGGASLAQRTDAGTLSMFEGRRESFLGVAAVEVSAPRPSSVWAFLTKTQDLIMQVCHITYRSNVSFTCCRSYSEAHSPRLSIPRIRTILISLKRFCWQATCFLSNLESKSTPSSAVIWPHFSLHTIGHYSSSTHTTEPSFDNA